MLYANIDINSAVTPFLNKVAEENHFTPEALYPFVDIYAKTPVTDLVLNMFCQYSASPSFVWTTYADKYEMTTENGLTVDYRKLYEGIYRLNAHGIDPYRVWVKRVKELGMHPWLSVRMNDAHCPELEACFLRSDFQHEAWKKGWCLGEEYGYFRRCLNYGVPEVREKMLAYLQEQIEAYDTDGWELDFQRELYCFDYKHDKNCIAVMNEFIRKVRAMVDRAEKRVGHKIRLGVRLERDLGQNLQYGFDPETWVKENLVDLIVVTPRWATCDSDMPLEDWKAKFPNTEISAGLEVLVARQCGEAYLTPALAAGYAASYLDRKADSLYLFNQFMDLSPLNADAENSAGMGVHLVCGDRAACEAAPRRFIVTGQDIAPYDVSYQPLPITLCEQGAKLAFRLGRVSADRRGSLVLGFSSGDISECRVLANGAALSIWQQTEKSEAEPERALTHAEPGTKLYRAALPLPEDGRIELELFGPDTAVLCYTEAEIL